MAERYIRDLDLAYALSDVSCKRDPADETSVALNSMATELVLAGRVASAAELLEMAVRKDPHNPSLLNSLGFCLVPQDPKRALVDLERAYELGFTATMNLCNRLYALLRLGKYASVLELADRAVAEWGELDQGRLILWDFMASSPVVKRSACPRCYVRDIALYVANNYGDDASRRRWRDFAKGHKA
ncbi:tetratricopeptide repeat protein [Streptomyces xylophagus]|uniref:tetratricopeptide repeat protein n=1 Tax=Streptomyces xylophagus TaxID=285514 RepID=UPI00131AF6C7|nr:hypothetical protein [Streptomyces xylophagus]